MGQQGLPPIGSDVTHLNSALESDSELPPIGSDVTHLNEPQQGFLGKTWNKITSPLTDIPSNLADKFTSGLSEFGNTGGAKTKQEFENLSPFTRHFSMPMARGISAFEQGVGRGISGLTSPLNVATMGLSTAETLAAEKGLPLVANILGGANKAVSAGMVGEGAYHIAKANGPTDVLSGALEGGLGALGVMPKVHPEVPKIDSNAIPPQERPNIDLTPPSQPNNVPGGQGPLRQQELLNKFGGTQPGWKLKDGQFVQTPPEEPQFARADNGNIKIGADVASLGKILGSSLYKGEITKIASKELMQNAMDAVRPLGEKGNVKVILNKPEKYVEVSDNGPGMTRRELETVFTDLGSSGKRDEEGAIGGFGLAKAAPLLAGEKAQITSVVNEGGQIYRHTFGGTPDELLKGVKVRSERVDPNTPTGTTVRTYVPTDDGFYDADNFVKGITDNSFGHNAKIEQQYIRFKGVTPEINKNSEDKVNFEGARVIPANTPFADIDVIVPKDTPLHSTSAIKYEVLNNGMWQHSGVDYKFSDVPNIPQKILVNIRSKVAEGDRQYPFSANRESLRDEAKQAIGKVINDHIVNPAITHRIDELQKVWNSMPSVPIQTKHGTVDFFTYDTGQGLRPEELETIKNTPSIQRLSKNIAETLEDAIHSMGYAEKTAHSSIGVDEPNVPKRVGMIFDSRIHGINIPNPGSKGERAILINPFPSFDKLSPDQASANIVHTILHELAHQEASGHDENFTVKLGDVYAEYGAVNAINAQKDIFGTIADPSDTSRYNNEISEVLQRYTESRGRQSTSEDPLVGTGIKSADKEPKGTGNVSGNSQPSGESVAKLIDAIKSSKPLAQEQKEIISEERGERISSAMKSWQRKPTQSGMHKAMNELAGEHTKVDFEPLVLDSTDVNKLYKGIVSSPRLMPYEKFRTGIALGKLLEGKLPQENEIKLLTETFGQDFRSILNEAGFLKTGMGKFLIQGAVNVPKSIMASADFSAPLRQGLPLASTKQFWTSLDDMFKAFGSERSYRALQESLVERPNYLLGKRSGLQLTDMISQREEQYSSKIAENIPLFGHVVKASDRAYTGFLNKLRADVFDDLVSKWEGTYGKEVNDEAAKSIANFVNISTGRGSLGRLEKVAEELNTVFFSPRLISSRLTMLNPKYYVMADPFVRQQQIRALLSVAGAGLVTTSLGKALGGTINLNPVNPDFMKLKMGRTRLDPYGGFQQYIVAASQLITGHKTSSMTGIDRQLGAGFNSSTRMGVIGNMTRSKLSPAVGFAVDLLMQKDYNGRPINVPKDIAEKFIPMVAQDLYSLGKTDPKLLPLGIPAAFGMGLQTYEPNPSNSLQIRGLGATEPSIR